MDAAPARVRCTRMKMSGRVASAAARYVSANITVLIARRRRLLPIELRRATAGIN
jgi:hypothetical protein